jgi:hypothetical protein
MYMSMSFAPKPSRRTATPPALFVQNDAATSTKRVNTSQAPLPVIGGVASGWPDASKHFAPRSPPVYVPARKVGPDQVAVETVSLTWPLEGVAANTGDAGMSSERHAAMTRARRIPMNSFGRSGDRLENPSANDERSDGART